MEARGARDHRHAMLRQIRGDGGAPVAPLAKGTTAPTFIAFVYGHRTPFMRSVLAQAPMIKDPKLFKRLDRNMKKTGG